MNKMVASENLYGPNNFISKAEAMISKKRDTKISSRDLP